MTERPETSRAALADELQLLINEYDPNNSDWGFRKGVISELIIALRAPPAVEGGAVRWKHKKRGSIVTEIARGFAQVSHHPIEEMTGVVIYRHDADGRWWVRNAVEFDDGRFEAVVETGPVTKNEYASLFQLQIEDEAVREALALLKEAKELLAIAYKGGSYKSKINSAVWRLTYAERALAPPQTGDGK